MSIVALVKVSLFGLVEEKARVLGELQTFGCLHLIPLRSEAELESVGAPSPQARTALRFLLTCRERHHQVHDATGFNPEAVERRLLEIQVRLRALADERDFLVHRIRELEPWGDFELPESEDFANLKLWFYIVPHYQMRDVRRTALVWAVVHRDSRFSYLVVIAEEEPRGLPVRRTHTGNKSLSALQRRLEEVEVELDDLQAERASLTRWIDLFARSLNRLEDQAEMAHAAGQTLDTDAIFTVQGWVAHDAVPRLRRYARTKHLALVLEEVEASDRPPTLLRNPRVISAGEDLVSFYVTPGYRIWDPSAVVFVSFVVFFAMILSDVGYSVLLGLFLAMVWQRLGHSTVGRRLRGLFVVMVAASTVWGVLTGTYFGAGPPAASLARLKIVEVSDADAMMRLSVLVGLVHVAIANLTDAWHLGWHTRALAPLGWIAILLGGALWIGGGTASRIGPGPLGPWLVAIGAAAVLLFSGGDGSLLRRLLNGLLALSRLPNAFGDVLSYLRLFALGLATSSLAIVFNQLALDAAGGMAGFGVLLATLILIIGHGLNLALAVMSGFVHGLRLNFIEFFNWSVSEEGYPFRAFAKKEGQAWSTSSSR